MISFIIIYWVCAIACLILLEYTKLDSSQKRHYLKQYDEECRLVRSRIRMAKTQDELVRAVYEYKAINDAYEMWVDSRYRYANQGAEA